MGFMLVTQCDQLPGDWIAQLVEHCIGIVEDLGSNPIPSVKILSGFDFTAAQIVLNDHYVFAHFSTVQICYLSYVCKCIPDQ